MHLASLAQNGLPAWLLRETPYYPWDIIIGVCLLACVPRSTRRWGGILLCIAAGILGLSLFINYAYASFIPK